MKRILFVTGTRADFGKLEPLMEVVEQGNDFECSVFVTGMHMMERYGGTYREVIKSRIQHSQSPDVLMTNTHMYMNQVAGDQQDVILANTIMGLARFVTESTPDMIVVHGDRVESLAAAIVGSMRNILVGHIEGGEVSGTIDELIRHSITKLAHIHFVANDDCKSRLMRMGECSSSIYVIGSPDLDSLKSDKLPLLEAAKRHYELPFDDYAIVTMHPVTTEIKSFNKYAKDFVDALIESGENYVAILPNNDPGSEHIFKEYERLRGRTNFKLFPSIRFSYFLVLMKHAKFMIGNSSAGVREMPFCARPSINVGTRQQKRSHARSVINVGYSREEILQGIRLAQDQVFVPKSVEFGFGNSAELFGQAIDDEALWSTPLQKAFTDLEG
ncbi:MAG: UDP-N-acetylglucosamine 2-epimerase [Candidatus Sedimenticola sp. 6PFRAG7]